MARPIDSMLSCPAPLDHRDIVELAHGGGGRKTARLIETLFAPAFRNPHLAPLGDGGVGHGRGGRAGPPRAGEAPSPRASSRLSSPPPSATRTSSRSGTGRSSPSGASGWPSPPTRSWGSRAFSPGGTSAPPPAPP